MNTNKKRRSRLAKVYTVKIREDITKMIERANHFALAERQVTLQTAIEVANRDLRRTVEMHPDRRAFSALKAVSAHIALASNNKYTSASLNNSDLLPVGHPMSTAIHAMTSSALAHAQARWIAADKYIADDTRALVASAYSLTPGSIERRHAFARLSATPNTSVPRMLTLDPIIAVGGFGLGGDSKAARSMRAKLQRRDRYGRFAFMGGGFSFNLRGLDGLFGKLGGRVVGAGGDNAVEIEVKGHPTVTNGIYALPAGKGTSSKAWLPESVDVKDSKSSTDLFIDESSLQRLDAPSGWDRQSTDPGAPESWTSKDGYFVTKDGDSLSLNRANSADNSIGEQVASSDSWADIQKAALDDQDDYEKVLEGADAPDFIAPEEGRTVLDDGLSKVESALRDIPEEDLDNLDEEDSDALNKVNDLLDSAQEAIDSIDPVGSDTNDLRFDQARADLGEIAQILSESNNGDMQNAGFDLKEKIDEFINLPQIDFGGGRAERASRETSAPKGGPSNNRSEDDVKNAIADLNELHNDIVNEGADPTKSVDEDGVVLGTKFALDDGRTVTLELPEAGDFNSPEWVLRDANGKVLNRVDSSEDQPENYLFRAPNPADAARWALKERASRETSAPKGNPPTAGPEKPYNGPSRDELARANKAGIYSVNYKSVKTENDGSKTYLFDAKQYDPEDPDDVDSESIELFIAIELGEETQYGWDDGQRSDSSPDPEYFYGQDELDYMMQFVDNPPTGGPDLPDFEGTSPGPIRGRPFPDSRADEEQRRFNEENDGRSWKQRPANKQRQKALDFIRNATDEELQKGVNDGGRGYLPEMQEEIARRAKESDGLATETDDELEAQLKKDTDRLADYEDSQVSQSRRNERKIDPADAKKWRDRIETITRELQRRKKDKPTAIAPNTIAKGNGVSISFPLAEFENDAEFAVQVKRANDLGGFVEIDETPTLEGVDAIVVTFNKPRLTAAEANAFLGDPDEEFTNGAFDARFDNGNDEERTELFDRLTQGNPPTAGPATRMPGDDGSPDDADTRNLPTEQDYMDDPAIDGQIKSMDSYLAEEFDSMF